jgi:hypothetical protein
MMGNAFVFSHASRSAIGLSDVDVFRLAISCDMWFARLILHRGGGCIALGMILLNAYANGLG